MLYLKRLENIYEVRVDQSNKLIGRFIMSDDGFYYFEQEDAQGLWSDYVLIEIGTKLKDLNRPWLDKLNQVL